MTECNATTCMECIEALQQIEYIQSTAPIGRVETLCGQVLPPPPEEEKKGGMSTLTSIYSFQSLS